MSVFLPIIIPFAGAIVILSYGSTMKRCTRLLFATGILHLLSVLLLLTAGEVPLCGAQTCHCSGRHNNGE